jgi:tRNA A-37 threonylcarbamoyl transferase component Bud32
LYLFSAALYGEILIQHSIHLNEKLLQQILDFCRRIAGSCQITAVCIVSDYALGISDEKPIVRVLLIIRDFQPRLMNYVKIFNGRTAVVLTVDKWIFERDVDRGFLGEALAVRLIFPYLTLISEDYLHVQEVKLKKRLILELLENLVLDFPELSYEIRIQPEYFMCETMLSRARLFPPMIYNLSNFMREDHKIGKTKNSFYGYSEALEALEKESVISFSGGYVKISEKFAKNIRSRTGRFINLFKTAQRTLFTYLLSAFPDTLSLLSQNKEIFLRFQKVTEEKSKFVNQIDDSRKYLYVPTASGLVPLVNMMDIEAFSRKVLSANKNTKVDIQEIGGILNDVYLIKTLADDEERRIVVKSFKDWSSFKWFPLTLWTVGTRTFAVLGRSRLERECAMNQLLYSKGFIVPKIVHVNHDKRLIFMEYVEGETIEKVIKRVAGSKSIEAMRKGLSIINKVGGKFAEVHALDISLGDTKPENILVEKNTEICLLDFEQAARNGDKVWDIAEFLYYTGHYISPFVGTQAAELIASAFIEGYLRAGGSAKMVKKAGNPKYMKVFSVFTFPHVMLAISSICRKTETLEQ